MLWLAGVLALLAADDSNDGKGIPIPRAKPAAETTVIEQAATVIDTAKEEMVELSTAAVQAPVDMAKIILAPVRDSYQLIPGKQEPVLPVRPPVKDDPLGTTTLMVTDAALVPQPKWKYRVEGGGNFRYGTVNATNVNTVLGAERRSGFSIFTSKFGATYNQLDDAVANRRFFGDSKYDHFVSGRWILYGKEELENDQARRLDLRSVSSAGLGYRLLDDKTARWIARTGPTVTYLNQNNPGPDDVSTVQSGWLFESELRRIFWDHCRFEWNASVFPNFTARHSFRIRNEVGVLFPIGSHKSTWNWKIGLRDEYTESPGVEVRPHDTEMFFAIVYSSG
jgi:putative salt-induced outer membrane protein YdiY